MGGEAAGLLPCLHATRIRRGDGVSKLSGSNHVFLARAWYEKSLSGPKVSNSARASSSGIVVLSYGGCKVGVDVGGVCITRRCALRGRARYDFGGINYEEARFFLTD